MNQNHFIKEIEELKAYRKTRLDAAEKVVMNPSLLHPLLKMCYRFNDPLSSKACWVLEFVCDSDLSLIQPHLSLFIDNLQRFKLDSSIRPVAKICLMMVKDHFSKKPSVFRKELDGEQLEKITEACFDWLINDEKVAAKAYAIYCLYELGKKYDWVYPELKMILVQRIPDHSAAYKAAAGKILKKLNK
ncbi:hypothetical protein GWK08_00815 [Leptobacterium flavescens]|uniref:Adenylosuccinate lyase n=1 Tax=Leptobacterium flavescens TaxID=472055 RepID=A0A6P0UJ62_9FLAO|nr:hypothetical protein [Leptobacterium flavescens]NER11968.1 hypothetical protein [Leptobacterium flavescens]